MRIDAFAGFFQQAGDRTRTGDPLFTRQALYQLSYSGTMAEFTGDSAPFSACKATPLDAAWALLLSNRCLFTPSTRARSRSGSPSRRSIWRA